ncbi:MAG: toll/interleukin-1 receptor domain-containing protein [Acidobacteria bacterium]|nr:toll/interleukin-1 receptor domain-containing protein [Acidobacteriota bacterium]
MADDYRVLRDWLRSNGYEYWCFLSWARGPDESRDFVEDYRKALGQELLIRVDSEAVFLDVEALKPGDDWRARLGAALCRSVLTIPVYTPPYFWPEHRYCGMEWGVAFDLSKARLGDPAGLFPLVLRAPDQIPAVARGVQWEDLSPVALRSRKIRETPEFRKLVKSTVDRALEVGGRLRAASAQAVCDQFTLPDKSRFDGIYAAAPALPFRGRL